VLGEYCSTILYQQPPAGSTTVVSRLPIALNDMCLNLRTASSAANAAAMVVATYTLRTRMEVLLQWIIVPV
jgi:hypothetical protein